MPTLPGSTIKSFEPLFLMCLALLLTPSIVAIVSLLSKVGLATVLTRFLNFGTSLEMIIAALLAVAIGTTVYLVIAALSTKRPTLADMVAIELSQALGFFMSIGALLHNPQEEFCKANPVGSALAKAYQLDSCSLTIDFWIQTGVGGLIAAVSSVLLLRLVRAAARAISS